MSWDGKSTEAGIHQPDGLRKKSRFAELTHAVDKETVGIFTRYFSEIFILLSVDKLLHDHCRGHLCIVHVREKDLGSVASVDHERREHLALLAHEIGAPVGERTDAAAVDHRVLTQPQMRMCVNYEMFHDSPKM